MLPMLLLFVIKRYFKKLNAVGKLLVCFLGCILILSALPTIDLDDPWTELPEPVVFEGALQSNNLLSGGEIMYRGNVLGPESIAEYQGNLYSGNIGGKIIRMKTDGSEVTVIANLTDTECRIDEPWTHKDCGHPLGVRIDTKGQLYAIDAFLGIMKVDIQTGVVENVFDPRGVSVDGQEILFMNDLVIHEGAGSNGGYVFYMTDMSAKANVETIVMNFLSLDNSGRILRYDKDSGNVSVVASKISFPNGIELTDDKQAVIVSGSATRELFKVLINGPPKTEILNGNLPCMPDNVRRSGRKQETYWTACFSGSHKERDLWDTLRRYPFLTKALMRFSFNTGSLLMKLGQLLGIRPLLKLGYPMRMGAFFMMANKGYKKGGLVFEFDASGNILRSLQDPEGKLVNFSEVHEILEGSHRHLYIGSGHGNFVLRVTIDNEELEAASTTPLEPTADAGSLSKLEKKTPVADKTQKPRVEADTASESKSKIKEEL